MLVCWHSPSTLLHARIIKNHRNLNKNKMIKKLLTQHLNLGFDPHRLPSNLQPLAWLVGIWRSEHGGKAIFPTIPKFTYGEQIEIAISDDHMQGLKALNYS